MNIKTKELDRIFGKELDPILVDDLGFSFDKGTYTRALENGIVQMVILDVKSGKESCRVMLGVNATFLIDTPPYGALSGNPENAKLWLHRYRSRIIHERAGCDEQENVPASTQEATVTPEEFVEKARKSIIEENLAAYRSSFSVNDLEKAGDEYGSRVLQLLSRLEGEEGREALFFIIRQVMVDTLSNLFGILDGSSQLGGRFEDFSLIHEESGERLDGDLQDYFLSEEE